MAVTRVHCRACGAEVEAAAGVRYVSCNDCCTALEVVREASVTYTRPLMGTEGEAAEPAEPEDRRVNELYDELVQLDHEWDVRQESFRVVRWSRRRWSGPIEHSRSIPTVAGSVATMATAVLSAVLLWIAFGGSTTFSFALVGLAPMGLALLVGGWHYHTAKEYQRAKASMAAERVALEQRLATAKQRARRLRATEG